MKKLSPLLLAWISLAMACLQLTVQLMGVIHNVPMETFSFPDSRRRASELRSVESASSEWRLKKEDNMPSWEFSSLPEVEYTELQPKPSSRSAHFMKLSPAPTPNQTHVSSLSPLIQQSETHFSQNFVVQPIHIDIEQDIDTDNKRNTSSLYWDLSCPLEMSMFAGSHMDGDFLYRARQARAFVEAERVLEQMLQDDWPNLQQQAPRRIFLVGDSLMRQVFISWSCLLWQHVESFAIPWFDGDRQVRARLPNTVWKGSHSKFEEGRVRFRNNTLELIYHHGMGGMLVLGEDYRDHDDGNLWIESCFKRRPLSTNVIDIPNNVRGEYVVTEASVQRQRVVLQRNDAVLMNGSVHRQRRFSLQNMVDLMDCMQRPEYQTLQPVKIWPTFAYIMTGSEHFPTETGAFEARLLRDEDEYQCRQESTRHDRQDEEWAMLSSRMPMLGDSVVKRQSTLGHLHVGGRDCLHWLQPGMPDLIAAEASHFVASLHNSR